MRYQSLHQGITGGKTLFQIVLRAALWMVAFNILYLVVNPFQNGGLPTLYNSVFPGRLRIAWTDSTSTNVIKELKLSRLFSDHIIAKPKAPDEFRAIVLGSSETWGYFNRAQDTWPVVLDNLHIPVPEGKTLRVYNMAFPLPDGLKDVMMTQYMIDHHFQPDMIIWAVNANTFTQSNQPLTHANPDLALAVADRYGIDSLPLEAFREAAAIPAWQRQNFFAERDHVAYWLINQMFGFVWATTQVDYPPPDPLPQRTGFGGTVDWDSNHPDLIKGFAELARTYTIPLLVVVTPANYTAENFSPWLAAQLEPYDIPWLNCQTLLPVESFTNSNLHINAAGHVRLAEQVAPWLKAQLSESSGDVVADGGCVASGSGES